MEVLIKKLLIIDHQDSVSIQMEKWVVVILVSVLFFGAYMYSQSNYYSMPTTYNQIGRVHLDAPNIYSDDLASLKKLFVIFLVPSTPFQSCKRHRHYLRTKWLNYSSWRKDEFNWKGINLMPLLNFKMMFVLGKPRYSNYSEQIMEEVSLNDDIYLMNELEARKGLKSKVLWGMKESVKRFRYDYLIKIDHDTLVDLPHLVKRIQWLRKEKLYTGSCLNRLKTRVINIRYCQGGAYILSRDVVEKIASLSDDETTITLGGEEPEDAYTGWLVTQIREQLNVTGINARHNSQILNIKPLGRQYQFNRWFYHGIKGWDNMNKAFECRINADAQSCPSSRYIYRSYGDKECYCDDKFSRLMWFNDA